MKAFFKKIEITPPLNIRGSYRLSPNGHAKGVHDSIYARWMVLSDPDHIWALISLDLAMLQTEQADLWRKRFAEAAQLPIESVTLACTHTHNGPDIMNEWGEYDHDWEDILVQRLAAALKTALASMVPARLGWGDTKYEAAINRHERSVGRAEGPINPQLSTLRVEQLDGKPLGHLLHYTAHPTTALGVDCLISADYPGVVLDYTERELGGIGLFLQGAAGNINLEVGDRSYEHMLRHGRSLGKLAFETLCRTTTRADVFLESMGCLTLEACIRDDLDDMAVLQPQLDALLKQLKNDREVKPYDTQTISLWNQWRVLHGCLNAKKRWKGAKSVQVPVHYLKLNNRLILTLPGEWFVEYSLQLNKDFLKLCPLFVGYSNGYIGYVPTKVAYKEAKTYMDRCKGFFNYLARGEGERLYGLILPVLKNHF